MDEGFTVRVNIVGIDGDGNIVGGTVVVNVCDDSTVEDVLGWAMDYVDNGGFAWGAHGSGPVEATDAEVEYVTEGLSTNPSTSIGCQ